MISRQMTLSELEILLNSSVETEDELRLSKQATKIYGLLKVGPVKTSELAAVSLQYNARLHELRRALLEVGLMIDKQDGENGENEYTLVELSQSTFWQRIQEKGGTWKWL